MSDSARLSVDLVEAVKGRVREQVAEARRLPSLRYADLRLEVIEARSAAAENGHPRGCRDDATLALGVRVLAGDRMVAPGYVGLTLGVADAGDLERLVREALAQAWRRARVNGELKAETRSKFGVLGQALADTPLHPIAVVEDTVPALYATDPRRVDPAAMVRETVDVCRAVRDVDPRLTHAYVGTLTQLARELFVSSEGASIDQAFALTQGLVWLVAANEGTSQELFDVMGHQRGWEVLARGIDDPLLSTPPFPAFALALAADAIALVEAPPLRAPHGDVVVVTDPHYNALLAHEIVGHPVELDRALKMETAYAGRSWLFRDPADHSVGRQIASPLVTAYSDPALPGYGHYRYDHEGTPGHRVVHIERGVLQAFMNSRQTAAVFGGSPNGHWKATDASLVPLVRMSTTVFAGGTRPAAEVVREVDRGWYLEGHRVPSIAESRENFRISARKVYEIRDGRLGQLYRDGGLSADSHAYLMNVDAVGDDFRLVPIPNCGKGQPMQVRRLGNGGPTMRSRARLVGPS